MANVEVDVEALRPRRGVETVVAVTHMSHTDASRVTFPAGSTFSFPAHISSDAPKCRSRSKIIISPMLRRF